jgi:hypothetical protein
MAIGGELDTISLVSASIAVQVQTSPAPSGAALAVATFFCLAWQNDQISSHWIRLAFTLRTESSWIARQASPACSSSLVTVLIDTSATRLIERMDDPSHNMARI